MDADDLEPFTDSTPLIERPEALRERASADGFLFFRGLIDVNDIHVVREEILRECGRAGWLQPDCTEHTGKAREGVAWIEPQPEFMQVYTRVQHGERFHALAHYAGILRALGSLFGEEPLPHPRNIARIIFPNNTLHTTPAHQDYVHIQGTEETYTAWIPLGDCPISLGSLVLLRGSHRAGIRPVHRAYGAGGVGIDTGNMPAAWVGGDFDSGDVVMFHSLTVHKALPNLSPDAIRLSVDFRYQPLSHPIDPSSLLPHYARLTWDEIYVGWEDERLRYYWQKLPIQYAGADPRVGAVRAAAKETPTPSSTYSDEDRSTL